MPVYEGDSVQDLTGIRRAIANRMAASKREAPHAWTMVEVDMSGLVALREREKAAFAEREGVKLTYLPFIVKAVVESLKENPVLNSVWDGDRIILRKRINIGVAVDLEDALIVPVIPDADELNITGLTRRIDDLVKRARAGELGTEDISGGTFTVNNPGSLGSVVSTPIINLPAGGDPLRRSDSQTPRRPRRRHRHPQHDEPRGLLRPPRPRRRRRPPVPQRCQGTIGGLRPGERHRLSACSP